MLRTLEPNPEVQERLAARLNDFGVARDPGLIARLKAKSLGLSTPQSLGLSAPHPVFNLNVDAIGLPNWLEKLYFTSWRYFVTSGQKVVAIAEASMNVPSGPVDGTLTNVGPFVFGSERALVVTEHRPEMERGEFILSLLRVPALDVMALWLRNQAEPFRLDRFVPVAPAPSPMEANSLLDPTEFIHELRIMLAQRRSEGGDENDDEDGDASS